MTKDPIKKASNGTYCFRINIGYDAKGKKIQKYCSGFKTKKEAREEYSRLLLQKSDILDDEKEVITFKHYMDEIFVPWYKTQVRESTYRNRSHHIKHHLSHFNKMDISKISPLHVQNWQLKLAEKYGSGYIRSIQGLFSLAMDRAIVLGLATKNPSKVIGNVKKEKVKIEFWTKEEFEKVISQIYTEDYYQHFQFTCLWLLFMTGLRIGEATALQWDDLDFDKGLLSVSKNLYYKNQNDFSFTEPKTKASVRTIAVDSDTLNYLKEWKKRQQELIKTGFILSYNGMPTQKSTSSYIITRYAKLAGVHRIKTHALRHSHASLLISMGENPLLIKERLGHEDIETTLGTYGHLYPNSNLAVAQKLKGTISFTPTAINLDHSTKNQHTSDL